MSAWSGTWLVFLLAAPVAERGLLVDEVVAVVNRQLITRSEIRQEAVLILVERRGQQGLSREITPEFLVQVMELLINQSVLLDEAQKLGLPPVSEQQREQLLEGFRGRFADREAYARFLFEHDITEEEIGEILVRHLRVEQLKERRLRVIPAIGDAEVRQYYRKHRAQFAQAAFALVAEAIRLKLLTEQREQELVRWVWELRRRSEIKVLVDLAGREGRRGAEADR